MASGRLPMASLVLAEFVAVFHCDPETYQEFTRTQSFIKNLKSAIKN
jgi:hypothetical protein